MRGVSRHGVAIALLALLATLPALAQDAQPVQRGPKAPMPMQNPAMTPQAPSPADKAAADARRAQIKDLDDKIKALRDTYKSQADPLESQLKALRDKLNDDLTPLQSQRKQLVDEGKTPEQLQLDQQEADALARLAEREKADVDAVHDRYKQERVALQQDFAKRRHDLALAKR